MQFATIQSVTARPDLPAITDEEAAALARATMNLFRAWQLSDSEARTLLGDMAQRTWARWKEGNIGRIDRDPVRGYAWIKKPNSAFEDLSALDVMMRGDITDLIDLRRYLDAERGGW
jgi:hypothetical protein